MIKFHVNERFEELEDYLKELPEHFDLIENTIKNERNIIKIDNCQGYRLNIKMFKKITLINKLVYGHLRISKAKRSFMAANKLISKGIHTPEPVGYTEIYNRWGIIRHCYYVSLQQKYDYDMGEVGENEKYTGLAGEFSTHMAEKVHPAGVWHNDLSGGNILITEEANGTHSFSFIDLNRVVFKKRIPPRKGLKNMNKIVNNPVMLAVMGKYYAEATNQNIRTGALRLIKANISFYRRRRVKKQILLPFKKLGKYLTNRGSEK
jgi:hypothetical protein